MIDRIKEIIKAIPNDDKFYTDKVVLLAQLIYYPKLNYNIKQEIKDWCREQGLKVELNATDGSTWWSCRIADKQEINKVAWELWCYDVGYNTYMNFDWEQQWEQLGDIQKDYLKRIITI